MSVEEQTLTVKQGILDILTKGPMTDSEMVMEYMIRSYYMGYPHHSDSGLRTRRVSLVREGLVELAGQTQEPGRKCNLWKLKEE